MDNIIKMNEDTCRFSPAMSLWRHDHPQPSHMEHRHYLINNKHGMQFSAGMRSLKTHNVSQVEFSSFFFCLSSEIQQWRCQIHPLSLFFWSPNTRRLSIWLDISVKTHWETISRRNKITAGKGWMNNERLDPVEAFCRQIGWILDFVRHLNIWSIFQQASRGSLYKKWGTRHIRIHGTAR